MYVSLIVRLRPNCSGPWSSCWSHQIANGDGGSGWGRGEATNGFKVHQFSRPLLEFSGSQIRGRGGKWPSVMVTDTDGRFLDSRSFMHKSAISHYKDQNIGGREWSGENNSLRKSHLTSNLKDLLTKTSQGLVARVYRLGQIIPRSRKLKSLGKNRKVSGRPSLKT